MKVLCSGGVYNSAIESDKCIECSIYNGNPPCGYSSPLLRALFKSIEVDERANNIHVSDMLSCIRKAYLDKTNPQPQYVHQLFYITVGTAVHEIVERAVDKDENVISEMEVTDGLIKGRIDLYFKDIGRLMDMKTTRYMKVTQLPHGNHVKQVLIYASMLIGMGFPVNDIFIQYIDAAGPTKCKRCFTHPTMEMIENQIQCPECGYTDEDAHLGAVQIPIDMSTMSEVVEEAKQKALRLKKSMEEGSIPDAETGWICRYCSQTESCDEGQYFLSKRGKR